MTDRETDGYLAANIWRGLPAGDEGAVYITQNSEGVFELCPPVHIVQRLWVRIANGQIFTMWVDEAAVK